MRYIYFIVAVLMFHTGETDAANEIAQIIDKLDIIFTNLTERLQNLEDTLGGLVDTVSKLESVFECGWPKLEHGYYEGTTTFAHSVLQAYCNEGYGLHGNQEVECEANGKWAELPTCLKTCSSPRIQNSIQYDQNVTYPYNSEVRIQCKFGYRHLTAQSTMTCYGVTGWIGFTACRPVECGRPPGVPFGIYERGYTSRYNSSISIKCNAGYKKVGSDSIRCDGNRRWTGQQECLEQICIDVKNEDGTNSTECLLKQPRTVYFHGNEMESVYVYDQHECLSYCLINHGLVSYILFELDTSWVNCRCMRVSGQEKLMGDSNSSTFLSESDESPYKKTSPY